MTKRDRGRFLSEKGCNKIWQAIYQEFPDGFTLAEVSALTAADANDRARRSLSPDTISNIINQRAKADRSCIQSLFAALGITLDEEDLTSKPPIARTPSNDRDFVGRQSDMAHLDNLTNRDAHCILIWSPGGVGKTILAQKYLGERFGDRILYFPIGKETQNIGAVESLLEENLRKLGEEPGREFTVSLLRLQQKLQAQPMGILIDNLEPALDESGRFIEKHCNYVKLLSILTAPTVKSVTLITSRERLQENLNITPYKLPELSPEAWQEFWCYQGIDTDIATIEPIHAAYGGNALAMRVLCNPIQEDFKGNVAAYWRERKTENGLFVETAVENLIEEQFNRLKNVCPAVYNLLSRMGCYRYQDVPTVPKEGLLCLLWDVPERQRPKVVMALRDRALVELENGEYKLHPIVREAAIERLRDSEDWEQTNRNAAEFWTDSVETVETVDDALKALEAFYHYIEIDDKQKAADVIVKPRDNQWEEGEPLGCSFHRIGLLQQILSSINLIVDDIDSGYPLSRIYNILGDLYWLLGDLQKAIETHEKSEIIANEVLERTEKIDQKLIRLKTVSFFNRGLCKIDQGKIEEAIQFFEECIKLARDIFRDSDIKKLKAYEFVSWYTLAFCYSYLGMNDRAFGFLNEAYKKSNTFFDIILGSWGKGYSLLFLGLTHKNLADIEKAFEMYNRAILYAEDSHYPQVKAKALTGLAELHRIQKEFDTALSHHAESIEILEKIGAKCDLAEAYYQRGLTYQAIGELENSTSDFNRAIHLWEKIGAPKQVIRVRQSMNQLEGS